MILATVSAVDSTGCGAGDVADGAKANRQVEDFFAGLGRCQFGDRYDCTAAAHDRPLMGEVDRRQFELFALDVLPDIQFGPVRDREGADVLALEGARVVQIPQLRALVLRVPLAELVAEAEDAFLGARLFLVAPRTADAGVELEFVDRFEQASPTDACCATRSALLSTTVPRAIESSTERTIRRSPSSAARLSRKSVTSL